MRGNDVADQSHPCLTFLDGHNFVEAIGIVARSLCENNADQIQGLVDFFLPFLLVPYDSQRIVVCAFFAEVIQQG